eukprot:RCo049757
MTDLCRSSCDGGSSAASSMSCGDAEAAEQRTCPGETAAGRCLSEGLARVPSLSTCGEPSSGSSGPPRSFAAGKRALEQQLAEIHQEGFVSYLMFPTQFPGHRRPTLRFISPYDVPQGLSSGPVHRVPVTAVTSAGAGFFIQKAVRSNVISATFLRAGMHAVALPSKEGGKGKKAKPPAGGPGPLGPHPEMWSAPWNVIWARRVPDEAYPLLCPYQKVNYFPGTWNIGRKDWLHRTLQRMRRAHGADEFGFVPQTFLLPGDWTLLRNELEAGRSSKGGGEHAGGGGVAFILKPPDLSRGRGIYLVSDPSEVADPTQPCVAQRYVSRPMLINGFKFDIRMYAAVTCFDPLRIYIHEEGLVRFATEPYSRSTGQLGNRFMHLTNFSVNKKSARFAANTNADADDCGSKWSLSALWRHMEEQHGVATVEALRLGIDELLVKTVVSIEAVVNSKVAMLVKYRNSCYELYGFDVLVDENLKLYLLEINILPSLHTGSPLDKKIKTEVVADLFNLVGLEPYDRAGYAAGQELRRQRRMLGFASATLPSSGSTASPGMAQPRTAEDSAIEEAEGPRGPHQQFIPWPGNNLPVTVGAASRKLPLELLTRPDFLTVLTEDDRAILRDYVDETSRAGRFRRVFPTAVSEPRFGRFFEGPRFHNTLLCRWEQAMALPPPHPAAFLGWLADPHPTLIPTIPAGGPTLVISTPNPSATTSTTASSVRTGGGAADVLGLRQPLQPHPSGTAPVPRTGRSRSLSLSAAPTTTTQKTTAGKGGTAVGGNVAKGSHRKTHHSTSPVPRPHQPPAATKRGAEAPLECLGTDPAWSGPAAQAVPEEPCLPLGGLGGCQSAPPGGAGLASGYRGSFPGPRAGAAPKKA